MLKTEGVLALTEEQVLQAARVLALSFHNDPVTAYIAPEENKRDDVMTWAFSAYIRYGLLYGQVYTTMSIGGVAVWIPSVHNKPNLWGLVRSGMILAPLKFGPRAFWRMTSYANYIRAVHERVLPDKHWYLFILGVDPAQQGQGIGSTLLQPMLRQADAEALPCYLETATEYNVGFYSRHGFVVAHEGKAPQGSLHLWAMLRHPRKEYHRVAQ